MPEKDGFIRELQAILTLYLGTVLSGFNFGFSATTIPDIKLEWEMRNTTSSFIPEIEASDEELSWFGKNYIDQLSQPHSHRPTTKAHRIGKNFKVPFLYHEVGLFETI